MQKMLVDLQWNTWHLLFNFWLYNLEYVQEFLEDLNMNLKCIANICTYIICKYQIKNKVHCFCWYFYRIPDICSKIFYIIFQICSGCPLHVKHDTPWCNLRGTIINWTIHDAKSNIICWQSHNLYRPKCCIYSRNCPRTFRYLESYEIIKPAVQTFLTYFIRFYKRKGVFKRVSNRKEQSVVSPGDL